MHLAPVAPTFDPHRWMTRAFEHGCPQRAIHKPLVQRFAFLIYEQRDLDAARQFWTNVGLEVAVQTDHWLAMSASGETSFVLVATKGKRSRFVGSAFVVNEGADLRALVRDEGAVRLPSAIIPGGGEAVSFVDQSGQEVWLIKR